MEHPDRYPNRAVVFLLQPQEVASVVTSNRLRLLSQGRVSVGRAAEIARMDLWEFADLLRARRIRWVSDDLGDELKASWKR